MNAQNITTQTFENWLRGYKAAWEGRDSRAATELFTDQAEYYWTPFVPPQRGKGEIAAAWEGAVRQQKDVQFTFEVLAVSGATGIARWHTRLTSVPSNERVEIDGILLAEFAEPMRCCSFREWWHSEGKPY